MRPMLKSKLDDLKKEKDEDQSQQDERKKGKSHV